MIDRKKRKRIGYGPMGTPGAGPGKHHRAAAGGSGRLGRAMRLSVKGGATPPTAPQKAMTRALGRWENEGGEVEADSPPAKAPAAPGPKRNRNTGKQPRPSAQTGKVARGVPPAFVRREADSTQQLQATTAAKYARKNEAGLGGRRTGKASATGKRAQGRRDSKH